MPCPHCGKPIPSSATRTRQQRKARGLCIDCSAPMVGKDREVNSQGKPHVRCFLCRRRVSALKRRRAKRPVPHQPTVREATACQA